MKTEEIIIGLGIAGVIYFVVKSGTNAGSTDAINSAESGVVNDVTSAATETFSGFFAIAASALSPFFGTVATGLE